MFSLKFVACFTVIGLAQSRGGHESDDGKVRYEIETSGGSNWHYWQNLCVQYGDEEIKGVDAYIVKTKQAEYKLEFYNADKEISVGIVDIDLEALDELSKRGSNGITYDRDSKGLTTYVNIPLINKRKEGVEGKYFIIKVKNIGEPTIFGKVVAEDLHTQLLYFSKKQKGEPNVGSDFVEINDHQMPMHVDKDVTYLCRVGAKNGSKYHVKFDVIDFKGQPCAWLKIYQKAKSTFCCGKPKEIGKIDLADIRLDRGESRNGKLTFRNLHFGKDKKKQSVIINGGLEFYAALEYFRYHRIGHGNKIRRRLSPVMRALAAQIQL